MRYPCPKCKYAASDTRNLKNHIESKPKGVRYLCFECKHVLNTAGALKRHVKRKHKGVRYTCSWCDYAATTTSHLKRRVENTEMYDTLALIVNILQFRMELWGDINIIDQDNSW